MTDQSDTAKLADELRTLAEGCPLAPQWNWMRDELRALADQVEAMAAFTETYKADAQGQRNSAPLWNATAMKYYALFVRAGQRYRKLRKENAKLEREFNRLHRANRSRETLHATAEENAAFQKGRADKCKGALREALEDLEIGCAAPRDHENTIERIKELLGEGSEAPPATEVERE